MEHFTGNELAVWVSLAILATVAFATWAGMPSRTIDYTEVRMIAKAVVLPLLLFGGGVTALKLPGFVPWTWQADLLAAAAFVGFVAWFFGLFWTLPPDEDQRAKMHM